MLTLIIKIGKEYFFMKRLRMPKAAWLTKFHTYLLTKQGSNVKSLLKPNLYKYHCKNILMQ
jgi:hypothetical protein